MLLYLKDVEARIERQLLELHDASLGQPYDADGEFGESRLAHFIYALRHTMHHHGALSLLSLQLGNGEGIWL